jgi:hypothetical protein
MKRLALAVAVFALLSLPDLSAGASPAIIVGIGAKLTGSTSYPHARGSATYVNSEGRHLGVTVTIPSLPGKRIGIWANHVLVGLVTVPRDGIVHFRRSQGVPRLRVGDLIAVRVSGRLVASGRFRPPT